MSTRRYHPARTASTYLAGIELHNFKSVRHCDVGIGPLTVVTGANSAGKSSLLQVVLALIQISRRPVNGGRLQLNDDLTRLGTFASLRHQQADDDAPIAIRTEYSVSQEDVLNALARNHVSDSPLDPEQEDAKSQTLLSWTIEMDAPLEGRIGSARISSVAFSAVGREIDFLLRVDRTPRGSPLMGVWRETVGDEHSAYSGICRIGSSETRVVDARLESGRTIAIYEESPAADIVIARFAEWLKKYGNLGPNGRKNVDLSNATESEVDRIRDGVLQAVLDSMDEDSPDSIVDTYWNHIFEVVRSIRRDQKTNEDFLWWYQLLPDEEFNLVTSEIFSLILETINKLGDMEALPDSARLKSFQQVPAEYLASNVHYLGPLRHSPHLPFAATPDPDATHVGTSGEHVAAVLQAQRSSRSPYPRPPDPETSTTTRGESTLEEAVNVWLGYLGLASAVQVREDAPLVLGVGITPPGLEDPVPLGSVGVGVSQVLPVIVQCLVAGPGALVVLEQPELHLHPAAQQRLADFLIACTRWGQRFLIESHSEHLVMRLRRRIAEDQTDSLRQQVVILFAERGEEGDTTYRKVEVTETGGVLDWPEGFFDQGPDDAHKLLVAAAGRQNHQD